jgi:hypothetical protein
MSRTPGSASPGCATASPVLDCCDLIRRGADRVQVAELVAENRDLQSAEQKEMSRFAFVTEHLTEPTPAAA